MKIKVSNNIWDHIPTDSQGNEDWSCSNNGGNYAFGHRDVFADGVKVGELQTTSSEFEYCEITGTFSQETTTAQVEGTDIVIRLEKCWAGEDTGWITPKEFVGLLKE